MTASLTAQVKKEHSTVATRSHTFIVYIFVKRQLSGRSRCSHSHIACLPSYRLNAIAIWPEVVAWPGDAPNSAESQREAQRYKSGKRGAAIDHRCISITLVVFLLCEGRVFSLGYYFEIYFYYLYLR